MKRFDYPGRPSTGHPFGRGGRALRLSAAAAICLGGFLGAQAQSPFASGRVSEILTGTSGLPLRIVEGPLWMEDPNVGVEGSSLRSGVIGDNGVTAFELPFVPGGQTVRWSIRATTEQNFDFLRFYVNGVEVQNLARSGDLGWTELSYALPTVVTGGSTDVLLPSDAISASSTNSPAAETLVNLLDGNPATVYRNFDKENVAITVVPQSGRSVVTGLRLTLRDYAPERAPATWEVHGSEDGQSFSLIASGTVPNTTTSGAPTTGIPRPPSGSLLREMFPGLDGPFLPALTNSPNFINGISTSSQLTPLLETPSNTADNYGQRIRGWFIPPATGAYRFWVAADDRAELRLSTDESVANTRTIASVPDWGGVRVWNKNAEQESGDIQLLANRAYYLEVIHKEGTGGDHLAVGWQPPTHNLLGPDDGYASLTGSSPANETVSMAFDRNAQTKFLVFSSTQMQVRVLPKVAGSVVTALAMTTAGDEPDRDPISYEIQGSNNGSDWESIATGGIPSVATRGSRRVFPFSNAKTFDSYRIHLNRTGGSGGGGHIQVAELELLEGAGVTRTMPAAHFYPIGSTLPSSISTSTRHDLTFANSKSYMAYRVRFPNLRATSTANSLQIADLGLLGIPGGHTLKWAYTKDHSVAPPNDGAWVDSIRLNYWPSIIVQPSGGTFVEGSTVRLKAEVRGGAGSTVAWYKDGGGAPLANGGRVSGADTPELVIAAATGGDSGSYVCRVTNPVGVANSQPALVVVPVAPNITTQPVDVTVDLNTPLNLSVTATGTEPLVYIWRRDGAVIPGATTATYSVPNATLAHSGSYRVTVTNLAGAAQSTLVPVTVKAPPVITAQPVATLRAVTDQTVNLAVTVSSSIQPVTYRWRKGSTALVDGARIQGAEAAVLTLSALEVADAGSYSVEIANEVGAITSSAAALTVTPRNLAPTLDPLADVTITEDAAATSVALSGITDGNGGGQSLTVAATSSNPSILPNPVVTYATPNATGSLALVSAAGRSGTVTVTVRVRDDGGIVDGAPDTVERQFTVTIRPQNDAPTLDALSAVTIVDLGVESGASLVDALSVNPPNGVLRGAASWVSDHGGRIQLTPASVSSGLFFLPDFNPGRAVRGFTARFRLLVDQGASTPADGLSFNFIPEDPSTVDVADPVKVEYGIGSGLSVAFITWPTPLAVLRVGGREIVRSATFPIYSVGSSADMPWAEVVFSPDRKVTVRFNGRVVFDAVQTTLDPAPGWRFGWGARGGGGFARHSIDDLSIHSFLERIRPRANVLRPNDAISNLRGSSPSNEQIGNAIDGTPNRKWLILGSGGMAFTVTPGVGPTLVDAFAITTANDVPQRDPADFTILGSNPGSGWEHIAAGQIPRREQRLSRILVEFPNARPYASYQIRFNRPQAFFDHMQIAEFELLGRSLPGMALAGISDGDDGRQRLTVTASSGNPSVMGVPVVNYYTPQPSGSLVFLEPPAGANGTAEIKVRVQDDGGTADGGIDAFERTFNVTVTPINQPPTLAPIDTVVVDTTVPVTIDVPLANIGAGGDSLPRTVAVTATSSTGGTKALNLTPAVAYTSPETTGRVSFTVGQGVAGVATVRVTVSDQGGTANGGVDTFSREFSVKAGPQPPVIEAVPTNVLALAGDRVVFTVKASGIGLSHQWSKDGVPIPGATGATLELPFVNASSVGVYSVQVSNNNLDNQQPAPVRAFLGLFAPPDPVDVQSSQQARFSSALTLPAGFTVARQWLRDGTEIASATGDTYTIGTTTTGSVGTYAARLTVTPPSDWNSGVLVLTTPSAPLRLISDLTTLRSTGLSTNGSRLTDRATDPNYTLIEPSPLTGPAVAVVTSGTFPTPPWLSGGANSAWISPSARLREPGTAAGTEYIYRTTFNLNGIDLQTVRFAGRLAADDGVVRILLNGAPLAMPAGTKSDAYTDFEFRPGSTRFGDRFPERGSLGSAVHVAVTGDTSGATGDEGEPLPMGAGVHGAVGSIWWTWRAPANSRVTVTTTGSAIPTVLSVFEGQALERLVHHGSADGAGADAGTARSVTFSAVAGREYPIRLDGYQGAEGSVRIVLGALSLGADGQPTGSLPALVELAPGLLPRENTLDFVVRNTADPGLDRGLTGLRVEFTAVQGVPRPVSLVSAPVGGVTTFGQTKTFIAQVLSGTPVTYEWYRNGQRIEGADEATLTFNRVEEEDAGTYAVRIQNLNGSVWTTPVPFEVDVPLTITAQPAGQNLKVGAAATFGVRFRGNPPLAVQWYRNGEPIPSATDTNLVIAATTVAHAGRYHAVVSDRDDFKATSEAVLNVLEVPQIVQEPLDLAGITGVDTLRLSTLVDGSAPVRHLWFRNDVPLAVADSPVLDLGVLRASQAGEYHLIATNLVGVAVSRKATVTVHEPPSVVSSSGGVKVYEGEKAVFSVRAQGSGDLQYSWYVGGTLFPAARGSSFELDGLTRGQSGEVSVVVSSPYGSVTNAYGLEVLQAPVPVVSTGVEHAQVVVLKPGWNSLFLQVQPEKNDIPTVFQGVPFTSIWRWSDPRTGPQFISDQTEANLDVARWQIHLPMDRTESFQNNLAAVFRHESYLIHLSGTQEVTLTVRGRPGYQRPRWAVDGYTLSGLPIDPEWPGGGLSVESFFAPSAAHFDAAEGQPRGVYSLRTDGSWMRLAATDTVKSGEAYWIYTKGGSDYLAPIEAALPGSSEITYTLGSDQKELAFTFRPYPADEPINNVFLAHVLGDQSLPLRINESAPQEGNTWRDLPNGYSVAPRQGSRRTIRLAASRDRIPGLRYEGIMTLRGGGVRHLVPLVIERDKPDAVAEVARPFNPVGLWMGVVSITHVSEVNGLRTNYVVRYETNRVDGLESVISRATTEVRNVQQGSLPTPVKEPFEMRLLLHTGLNGLSQILQNVTILKRPDTATVANQVVTAQQGGDGVLITDPALLGSFEGLNVRGRDRTGTRLSSPFYPMHQTNGIPFDAGLDLGRRIQASWSLPPGSPLNPYRHKFHPDHDNLDRSFKTYKAEAYPVRRTVVLDIPARQGSSRKPGSGQDDIEGTYTEVIEGVHRIPITVQGTVTLRRLVAIGTLNPAP